MANPLHLNNPMQAWETAFTEARESITRPLTEQDYYEATHHPRYYKRSTDFRRMGYTYLRRHIRQNHEAGRKSRARWQTALLPVAGAAAVASYMTFGLPGGLAMAVECGLERKKRSEMGTREDVMGRAFTRLSRVYLCFSGSLQFYDSANTQQVSPKDLAQMARRGDGLVRLIGLRLAKQPPRIRNSPYIARSGEHLATRVYTFMSLKAPETAL